LAAAGVPVAAPSANRSTSLSPTRAEHVLRGLDGLKLWLDRRKNAVGQAAREFGLPEPRGVLLLGVQGCGKSLTSKAIAAQWRLPLLRLDMGRIFSGLGVAVNLSLITSMLVAGQLVERGGRGAFLMAVGIAFALSGIFLLCYTKMSLNRNLKTGERS
jgi:hypothetical protein